MRAPLTVITLFSFIITSLIGPMPQAGADDFHLPVPGIMVHLSPGFNPPILKGIKVHPDNPFRFDFILDPGDNPLSDDAVKGESSKLIKYFLASLTIPEKDLWVNLSPYEKDRIIPQSFGLTEMGRDLLAEDYLLKQITASLIYPEDEIGKKFWKRIYEEAAKQYGTTNIPVNTFNKVWIVPEKAVVYENAKAGTAYVVESKLKVMLEQDYLALSHTVIPAKAGIQNKNDINALGSKIIREIVIPELTREVNENKNFAHLRQVYNSLILATWYKNKIKDSILGHVYDDKKKVAGVGYNDLPPAAIYQRYLQAFKKGVYNYIKEETDPLTQEMIPRKYFSGGVNMFSLDEKIDYAQASQVPVSLDKAQIVTVDLAESPNITRRLFIRNGSIFAASLALPGVARGAVGPVPNIFTARKLVIDHLKIMANTGEIPKEDSTSEEYWLNQVFKGNVPMYLYALDDIQTALDEGLEAFNKIKAPTVKQFSVSALSAKNALEKQTADEKLKRFFMVSWSRYMESLYNNDEYTVILKDVLRQRAHDIDPALGGIIDLLVRNTDKWDRNDIGSEWQKFNDEFLIPRKYYASVTPDYNGRNRFYFAVIYHIESTTQVRLPSGKTIDVLTGKRADNNPAFFMDDLGSAPIGYNHVFINLDAIEKQVGLYLMINRHEILPDRTIDLKKLPGFDSFLKRIRSQKSHELNEIIRESTTIHEMAHKEYEELKNIQLKKGFGLFQGSFDDLTSRNPSAANVVQSEVYAYLTQIRDSQLSSIVLFNLFEFFMRGTSTAEFYAACFILDQLSGKDLNFREPAQVLEQADQLLLLDDAGVSNKAKDALTYFLSQTKDKAMLTRRDAIRLGLGLLTSVTIAPKEFFAQQTANFSLLQDFLSKGGIGAARLNSILADGELVQGLKQPGTSNLDSLVSRLGAMGPERFSLFVELMGFKDRPALLNEFHSDPKIINCRDILGLFSDPTAEDLPEKVKTFEELFVGQGKEKIARDRMDVSYNFIKQTTKTDLEFFEEIIQKNEFPGLFDPSYPVDQKTKEELRDKINNLPAFEPVDMTAEGEVADTVKNREMKKLLRRYYLSLMQFYQFVEPINEDNRIDTLFRSLFAYITNEDKGEEATFDGHVGYKIIQLKFLQPILAHEQGHNISPLGLNSNIMLNEFVGDLYARFFEQASGKDYGYSQNLDRYQKKVNRPMIFGRVMTMLVTRMDPMHDEHYFARKQEKIVQNAFKSRGLEINWEKMFFALRSLEKDYLDFNKGNLKDGELKKFFGYSFDSDGPLNFNVFTEELLRRYFESIHIEMPAVAEPINLKSGDLVINLFSGFTKADKAMAANGGIDLTPSVMDLHTQNAGEAIKFHLDPAILQRLQNAPGFVPVIINIQPMNGLHRFLGINDAIPQ